LATKNEFLPQCTASTNSSGYLYHLDAMEDPAHPAYPQELLKHRRRAIWSILMRPIVDDATVDPRWARSQQRIEDAGTLYPKRMETVDDEIRASP